MMWLRGLVLAGAVAVGIGGMGCSSVTPNPVERTAGGKTASTRQNIAVAGITTDSASYAADATITASWTGTPGGASDWVALARAGSADTSFVSYIYTAGAVDGSNPFAGVSGGDYEARYYTDNSFNVLYRSSTFTVTNASTISTDPSYNSFAPVTVTFAGLPGNANDWIALSAAGSADTSFVTYKYTGGAKSGSIALDGVAAGTYVARAYENNTYVILKESAQFSVVDGVLATTLTTNKASYTNAETATVSYTSMSGSASDWIAIALSGSDVHDYITYQYTGGGQAGSKDVPLTGLADGSYVARAFLNNTFTLAKETGFTIGAPPTPLATDASTYTSGALITVTYHGLPGNVYDWVGISAVGSPDTSFVNYNYTDGEINGSRVLNGAPAGTYEARAYENDSYTVLFRSVPFTITAAPPGATTVSTAATYIEGDTITVTYAGMSGSSTDWIAIATEGSAANSNVAYRYTGGNVSGTATFSSAGLSAGGPYVARAYFNNTFSVEATSTPAFTVTPAGP